MILHLPRSHAVHKTIELMSTSVAFQDGKLCSLLNLQHLNLHHFVLVLSNDLPFIILVKFRLLQRPVKVQVLRLWDRTERWAVSLAGGFQGWRTENNVTWEEWSWLLNIPFCRGAVAKCKKKRGLIIQTIPALLAWGGGEFVFQHFKRFGSRKACLLYLFPWLCARKKLHGQNLLFCLYLVGNLNNSAATVFQNLPKAERTITAEVKVSYHWMGKDPSHAFSWQ